MKAVNLITTEERRGPNIPTGRSGGGAYVVLVLLGGLAVFALLYGLADHAISSRRSEVASLTARAQQAQARAGALTPYTSFLQMREQRVQTVTQLVDSRFDWAQAFQELGRVLPPGKVSLASLTGTVGSGSSTGSSSSSSSSSSASGSSATSATPPGSIPTFALTGCAVSQAEVALMLDRLRLIDGVSEVALQSSTKSGSSGSGGGSGASCEGGNVSFSAQITFDALPSAPTGGGSSSTGTASTATAPASTSASPAAAATAPVSTSSAGAVR